MEPIFIVAGDLVVKDIGLYREEETTRRFMHLVQAATSSAAEARVIEHYEAKEAENCALTPYCTRYRLQNIEAWEQIGEIRLL
jgi:hypothetical protein